MLNQNQTPLFSALKAYRERRVIPFDVPGHKHGNGIPELRDFLGDNTLQVDVNSMKPLDNIGNPTGVIREAEELLADAYGADAGFFLVNGTTFGVQAMVLAACQPGDKIILPRNVHESAIHALILSGAIPVYMQPEVLPRLGIAGGIPYETFARTVKDHPDAKAVFLINPTYYGITSDLSRIIKLAHKSNMTVLVDEAHGAHFHFHPELPPSAIQLGADMAAVSLHKTGGALTQSSGLLLNERVYRREYIKTILNLTQTTSASYLLMASLDVARKMLATEGSRVMAHILELARFARSELNRIDGLYAFGCELINGKGVIGFDETKLGVCVTGLGLTGHQVYDLLRDEYNIQIEFGDVHNILAILSVGDTMENVSALVEAFRDIAKKHATGKDVETWVNLTNPDIIVSPRDAFYSRKKRVPLVDAEGEISGESIMAYPPGIPIVSPGERIDRSIIDHILFLKRQKTVITGVEDAQADEINVLGY
jgi:arginine/lysine/ornithine decarboxylase